MTSIVEWKDVSKQSDSGRNPDGSLKTKFLALKTGNKYTVRPVHKPVQITKYYNRINGKLRTAIVADTENCPIHAENPDIKFSTRYAVYVFDRADGQLKIMEGPVTVFRPLGKRFEATGKNPGGNDGGDWLIEVTGIGMKTTYTLTHLEDKPFTKEEIARVKEEFKDDGKKLEKLYAPDSTEKIREKLFSEEYPVSTSKKSASVVNEDFESDNDDDGSDNSKSNSSDDFPF